MAALLEVTSYGTQIKAPNTSIPGLPPALTKDFRILSQRQRDLMIALCKSEGSRVNHLFEAWDEGNKEVSTPAFRRRLIAQLQTIDDCYPSGLIGYLNNSKFLLEHGDNIANVDYLKGWKPIAPQGESFQVGSDDYKDVEKLGKRELCSVGFVLAAGTANGLGCTLPIELATGTTYVQLYIESILAIERKYGNGNKLPLCIMVSDETKDEIYELLIESDNFGMAADQITVINQGPGVPNLSSSDAKLILKPDDHFNVLTSNHGQGDVHALLYKHGVAKKWKRQGTEWIMFLEDTNGLAFHNIPLMLGVSVKHSLVMNMLTYHRKAKEDTESLVKLVNEETNQTRTISVDYEQLEALTKQCGGDSPDEATGFSQFPGATNQFVVNIGRYVANLEQTNGILPEFVVRAEHGTLAHLECRMQDLSTILSGRDALKVGYTCLPQENCYSPVDTSSKDGVTLQQKGLKPRCIESGEADQYAAHAHMMRLIGCNVEEKESQMFNGINVAVAPQIIIHPDVALFASDYSKLFPYPERIKISSRSSLVVSGSEVTIESLTLDGALVVKGNDISEEQFIENKVVKNDGWVVVADEDSIIDNVDKRGYRIEKKETETICFEESLLDTMTRLSTCG